VPDVVQELTRRERDVLLALCRPVLDGDVFTEPASVREIAAALVVTEAAVKQHLLHLYDKFGIDDPGTRRRLLLAREAMRRGAVTLGDVEAAARSRGDRLAAGRRSFKARDWAAACECLSAAEPLEADDLELLAEAALWADRHDASFAAQERAFNAHLGDGSPRRAAVVAVGLTIHHAIRLELAAAAGWYQRAQRLLEDEPPGREHGYLALVTALFAEAGGDWDAVDDAGSLMLDLGRNEGDADLVVLGSTFHGLVLVRRGQVDEGMRLLDEAMATATAGELGMLATGIVYCRMMCACLDLHDYRRAGEWTEVVDRCGATTGMGGFPGDCRTHRVAVLIKRGSWEDGEREALLAFDETHAFDLPHSGAAAYELGEIRLRRGDFDGAEIAFVRAHEFAFTPQPGLSLLRLACGEVAAAASSIVSALADTSLDRLARSRLLPAQVEIALAAGDVATARAAVAELAETAAAYETPALAAAAEHARGELELSTGAGAEAAARFVSAVRLWQRAGAPYEAARARASLAEAHLASGNHEAVVLELTAAQSAFSRLGALPDLERMRARLAALGT
jgi:hypothetical protein